MSWLYGFYHKTSNKLAMPVLHSQTALHEYHDRNLDLWAGGASATLSVQALSPEGFLFVLGMPVMQENNAFRYPDASDWQALIHNPNALRSMDGHYALIHYDGKSLRFYNDPLGKRSLYFRESEAALFFCSDLTLLKRHGKTELDLFRFGAVWHSLFPPSQGGYAPLIDSYYKGVRKLGSGALAYLNPHTKSLQIENRLFSPNPDPHDPIKLLQSYCLLPHKANKRIGIGLSGGMDIRPLLAIYLNAEVPITIYNYGSTDNYDYIVAKAISKRFSLPFRHITYSEAEGDWQQVTEFMTDRGVVFNPLHSANLGYYPLVAQETDAYVSGYWGEVFRFRMMAANLKSLFVAAPLNYKHIATYLYRNPPNLFVPEVAKLMQRGFSEHLKQAVAAMPSSNEMLNPYWMHLFILRYWFQTLQAVNYPSIDLLVQNILPWVQPTMFSQHWQLGFFNQLNEGLHRKVIKDLCPALQQFPLSATDISAPYSTRQFILKLKSWSYYRKHPRLRDSRTTDFLHKHRQSILEHIQSQQFRQDEALNHSIVNGIVTQFYAGDLSQQNALVSLLAYALGK